MNWLNNVWHACLELCLVIQLAKGPRPRRSEPTWQRRPQRWVRSEPPQRSAEELRLGTKHEAWFKYVPLLLNAYWAYFQDLSVDTTRESSARQNIINYTIKIYHIMVNQETRSDVTRACRRLFGFSQADSLYPTQLYYNSLESIGTIRRYGKTAITAAPRPDTSALIGIVDR